MQINYKIQPWRTAEGQDGAIFKDILFRFETTGECTVYSLTEQKEIGKFPLDKKEILSPHSNSVCFGGEYADANDEFPLLYTNIYNNYSDADDKMEGVCCVYRIMRSGNNFSSELVQIIRIGFVENLKYWRSLESGDVRPYGNFTVDTENKILYAFTMRDKEKVTRYFAFDLPQLSDGIPNKNYGCNVVTLNIGDIKSQFDSEYSNYLQGACFHGGKIYSLEGFGGPDVPPRMQIIDPSKEKQYAAIDLFGLGFTNEPEMVDFYGGVLYYGDAYGQIVTFTFL